MNAPMVRTMTVDGCVVKVALSVPYPHAERDWACSYTIDGLERPMEMEVFGLDSIHVLVLALHGLLATLRSSGDNVGWEGGALEDGFPGMGPITLNPEWSKHVQDRLSED